MPNRRSAVVVVQMVGRAVTSDTRDPWFKCLLTVCCIEKVKIIKKREQGNCPIFLYEIVDFFVAQPAHTLTGPVFGPSQVDDAILLVSSI